MAEEMIRRIAEVIGQKLSRMDDRQCLVITTREQDEEIARAAWAAIVAAARNG